MSDIQIGKEELNVNNIKTIIDVMFDCFVKGKEKRPLTCHNCGQELMEDEVKQYKKERESKDEKPYCFACMSKMRTDEQSVDDSLMEGK